MSFPAKISNPGMCHSGPRPGIQGRSRHSGFLLSRKIARYFFSFFTRPENPISSSEFLKRIILGPDPESSLPLCLCAFVPLCLSLVSFLAQTRNPVCLCAFVPFPCVILGPDPESSLPLCLCAFVPLCLSLVSFRPQTRNPGALKTFRILAFAEYCPVFLQFLHST